MENTGIFMSDPSVGARRPQQTGFKVDANGVPLEIIEKEKANKKTSSNDITDDPAFKALFGHAGTEVKDPVSEGGNEDHWISGTANIPPSQASKQKEPEKKPIAQEDIPIDQMMIPTNDPNDISNNPELQKMLSGMKEDKIESDTSDSHTMKQ